MACGGAGSAGGGVYQIVPGTAGNDYTLSVDAGAQAWWTGKPWANHSLSMVSPAGTTQVKVEFAMNGNDGGSVWFDNAVLTVVPEPSTLALVAGSLVALLGYRSRRGNRRA